MKKIEELALWKACKWILSKKGAKIIQNSVKAFYKKK
jgi:hypothetical protein